LKSWANGAGLTDFLYQRQREIIASARLDPDVARRGRLCVREEAPHLGIKAFGLDCERVGTLTS
jgi:hypothetical protein